MSKLYEQLRDLAVHDATVYQFLKTQEQCGASDLDTAISLIKQLANEKQIYFKDAINARNMSVVPIKPLKMEPAL